MTEHYYSQQPQSKHDLKTLTSQIRGREFTFTTDAGVFSKGQVDFGSKLLIDTFSAEETVQGDFLDLGCGYGPIGISLAKTFPERHVVLVDVNERAVMLSKRNAEQNKVGNVEVLQSDGFANIKERTFASIITNPPIRAGKKLIYSLFSEGKDRLQTGGTLWIVIQKKQGAPSAIKYLESLYEKVEVKVRKKGYYIVCAHK